MSDFENKNPNNVLGGHKATLHNPNVSEEAKEHSKKVLENAGEAYDESSSGKTTTDDGEKNPGNVAGGYKATLNNPNVSDEAKEHAKKKLDGLE